jgi:glycosyltransferase involved in cell wall biosynthesis
MRNILFVNSNDVWGGGEKWHFNMAMALKTNGHKVQMICSPNSELSLEAKKHNIEVLEINIKNFSFLNPFKLIQTRNALRKNLPETVILNLPSDAKFCATLSYVLNIKNILYRRGMPHPLRNTYLNRFIFKRITTFIANSKEIKKSIIVNIPELSTKTKIIYNGVTPKLLTPKTISSPIVIGNLGRLVEQKGQHHLIEMACILRSKGFNFKLMIAGKGPSKEKLEKLILKHNLQDIVTLEGHVDSDHFFKRIDIFVFSSYFEGSANALIESFQNQIPAIAFNTSSNPEVIVDGVNGYLVPLRDEKALANKVIEITSSTAVYKRMQEQAQETILKRFNYADKVTELEGLI